MIVDDFSPVRQMQRNILEDEVDFEVVGEASNGKKAIELAKELKPDVVIMDISMPEVSGIKATRILCQSDPDIKVVACSSHSGSVFVSSMLEAGAGGYVLKESISKQLCDAIHAVIRGDTYLDPGICGESTLIDREIVA